MKNKCLKYIENKNKNIINNSLIEVSRHTRVLFFQKMLCRHVVPIPILCPCFLGDYLEGGLK